MIFKMLDNGNEDADLLELRVLIYWNLGCGFFGTEDAGFTGIEDAGFLVFRMLCNAAEVADCLVLRVPIQ